MKCFIQAKTTLQRLERTVCVTTKTHLFLVFAKLRGYGDSSWKVKEPPPAASAGLDGGAALWQETGRGWPCCTGLSCPLWCLMQRNRDLERCRLEAYQEQAALGYDVPSVGTLGVLLAASMRRYGRIGCLCRYDSQKNIWRRNRHYPKTNWSAEIWEMLLACQINESKARLLFIKFVYNKNLCSDEISTPTCCLVIVFTAALKAYIFCQMLAI